MARTGRPKKAEGGLTTDIKVRIDDETANALDKLCKAVKGTRADVIRGAIQELLSWPSTEPDLSPWDAYYKAGNDLEIAKLRIESAGILLKSLLKDTDNAIELKDKILRMYEIKIHEIIQSYNKAETNMVEDMEAAGDAVQLLGSYVLSRDSRFSELKNDLPASDAKKPRKNE